ncbi:unnamed protein product, partial [Rotaria magnacalcarata]
VATHRRLAQQHVILVIHLTNTPPSEKSANDKVKNFSITSYSMARWSVDQVGEWLRLIGFEKQITTFKDRHIDGNALKQLTVCDIPQLLIVTNEEDQTIEKPTIGEIRRFQKSLEEWREICGQSRSRKKTK